MSESKTFKRFGFKRTNTSGSPINTVTEIQDGEPAVISKIANEFAGETKHNAEEAVRNMSEVEANRRLNFFRNDHQFDPNMPDAAFDAIDDATRVHDHKGEAALVGELVEDSPYPEVN